jgi:ferritin
MKEQILSEPVKAKLNSLIGEELKAMYTYVYAANWCQNAGYLKAYDFFLKESGEEKEHSEALQKYILDLGCTPELHQIEAPEFEFESLTDVIYAAYDMEVSLGEQYSEFASEVVSVDAMTLTKIQDFIKIQTEAIGFYGDICSVSQGLSNNKFEQLILEKALVK